MKILIKYFILAAFSLPALNAYSQLQNETDYQSKQNNYDLQSLLVPGDDSLGTFRKIIFDALYNTGEKPILSDTLINDKETAINVSEAILFKIYGKKNIIKQRPYKVNFVDGYWILRGTPPDKKNEKAFQIIINAKNGEVIKLTR